jgi:hypothetical protein
MTNANSTGQELMLKTKILILSLATVVGLLIWPGISKAVGQSPYISVSRPLGDGQSDYQLPESIPTPGLFGVHLVFSKDLSVAGKAAVVSALTAGSDKPLTYFWVSSSRLTISNAGSTATFANDVVADVSYLAGGTDYDLLIIDSLGETIVVVGNDNHKGGLVYKKYKEYKEKFKNKGDKQKYFKIKWLKKHQKETYLYYKSIYETHKFDKDSEFNRLSAKIKEIYNNYRGYEGYKNYREYKEKVY